MNDMTFKKLCDALGFAMVTMRGNNIPAHAASARAKQLSLLIECFCEDNSANRDSIVETTAE